MERLRALRQKRATPRSHAPRNRYQARLLAFEPLEERWLLNGAPAIGINLENVFDFSPAWIFKDAFKSSRPWIPEVFDTVSHSLAIDTSHALALNLDAHGWPTQLSTGTNSQGHPIQQILQTVMFDGLAGAYAGGTYRAEWDGSGTVTWGGDAVVSQQGVTSQGRNFALLNVTPGNTGILMQLSATNTGNPIRNINVWMPDYNGQSFVGQSWSPGAGFSPFHPLFLERLAGFSTIRFMQLQETTSSTVQHWSDRRDVAYETQESGAATLGYSQNGMSIEYMVELVNELHANAWFSMPHMADDDFVHNFANQVINTLDPTLKVYVEWSNEAWNQAPGYATYPWLQQQLSLPENANLNFYQLWAREAARDFDLWTQVYAGHTDRLVRVAAGFSQVSSVTSQFVQALSGDFDAIAVAPYFGLDATQQSALTASTTVDQVLDQLINVCAPRDAQQLAAVRTLADQYTASLGRPIRLLTYEGGVDLTARNPVYTQFLASAATNSRMYTADHDYLRTLQGIGLDLYMHFVFTSRGPFGALHAMNQPASQAPNYQALLDAISGSLFAPDISITATTPVGWENGQIPAVLHVSRTGDTTMSVSIAYQTSGTATAADYVALPATIVLPAGQLAVDVNVVPVEHVAGDGDKTLTITLLAGSGYTVSQTAASTTVTLKDDDGITRFNLPIANPSFETGDVSGWTLQPTIGNPVAVIATQVNGSPTTGHQGTHFLWGAGANSSTSGATPAGVAQRLDVSSQSAGIDRGQATVAVTGWGTGGFGSATTFEEIRFFDSLVGGNQLGAAIDSATATVVGSWTQLQINVGVPVGTRSIELRGMAAQGSFGIAQAGLDDFSGQLTYPAVNQRPTLDPIDNFTSFKNSGPQIVNLTGIGAGPGDSQTITVTATSDTPSLIPNPTINYSSPNATGSLTFTPVTGTSGTAVITVTVKDNGGTASGGLDTIVRTFTITVDAAPKVVGVYVAGSTWQTTFRDVLDSSGVGAVAVTGAIEQGYSLPSGGNQYQALPWSNIDTLRIAFDKNVTITQDALTLLGADAEPSQSSFSYNASRHIATWTFAAALGINANRISLDNTRVTDAAGARLDGAWSDRSSTFADQGGTGSGTGSPGSDFNFGFHTLSGDVLGSGTVLSPAAIQVRNALGASPGASSYNYRADVWGQGIILSTAFITVRNALGTSSGSLSMPAIPANHATSSSASAAAADHAIFAMQPATTASISAGGSGSTNAASVSSGRSASAAVVTTPEDDSVAAEQPISLVQIMAEIEPTVEDSPASAAAALPRVSDLASQPALIIVGNDGNPASSLAAAPSSPSIAWIGSQAALDSSALGPTLPAAGVVAQDAADQAFADESFDAGATVSSPAEGEFAWPGASLLDDTLSSVLATE